MSSDSAYKYARVPASKEIASYTSSVAFYPKFMFFPEEFFPKEFFPRNGHFWRAVCCEGLASFLYVLIVSLAEAIVAEDISVPAATK